MLELDAGEPVDSTDVRSDDLLQQKKKGQCWQLYSILRWKTPESQLVLSCGQEKNAGNREVSQLKSDTNN